METDPKVVRQRFAHALLSPLTVILGSLDMLLSQEALWPDSVREVLRLAMTQTRRLQETLNELLATAEVEGNTVRTSWTAPAAPPLGEQAPEQQGQQPEADNPVT